MAARTHLRRSARATSSAALGQQHAAVALRVLRARMLHAGPLLRAGADLEAAAPTAAPAAPSTSGKGAALEAKLERWQAEVEKRDEQAEKARDEWLKDPTNVALEKKHLAAKDARESSERSRDSVLKQVLGGRPHHAGSGGAPPLIRRAQTARRLTRETQRPWPVRRPGRL